MRIAGSIPTITDCIFCDNIAPHEGGGMHVVGGAMVIGCTFVSNTAFIGGGAVGCTFTGNVAESRGG